MRNRNGQPAQRRLDALLNRRAALDAALRAEKEKQQAAETKRLNKLDFLVGRALRKQAARDPDFQVMLKTLLEKAVSTLDETAQNFLKANNKL